MYWISNGKLYFILPDIIYRNENVYHFIGLFLKLSVK